MKEFAIAGILGLLLLLGGCASDNKKTRSFESTIRAYEQVIRWGDLEKANEFLKEPAEFSAERHERLKNIQVNGYRVLSRTMTKDGVDQVVEIKYTRDASVVVRTITDAQKWIYDEEDERWYLASKVPEFNK